jgi:glucose/arabinose dehydrogenase
MYKFIFLALLIACNGSVNPPKKKVTKNRAEKNEGSGLPLETLKLPDGFSIEIYAKDVVNARSMSLAPDGTLYVGTRDEGSVYALKDTDGDNKIDKQYILLTDGNMPNGVAYRDGDLYIAEVDKILKIEDVASKLENPGEPIVVKGDYPTDKHHGWKYIAFGPDGKLYVPVGAPCNICDREEQVYASITRIDPDGSNFEIVHRGIRNTVGFNWHPQTGNLWFTDNGRDMMGDDMPACELNHATEDKGHFGYPYCHQGDTPDPDFGEGKSCSDYTAPAQNMGPHSAPLGMEFCTASNFPDAYKNIALVAEHGSWNRSKKIGYQVSMVNTEGGKGSNYKPFIEGWLDKTTDDVWGRPVDMEWMPDGSLLISDDFADVIYRVVYNES